MFRNQHELAHPCCSPSEDECGTKEPGQSELTDAELAKELNELTVHEREKVLDDIHGVAEVTKETPEFLDTCLRDLDQALSGTPKGRRKALDRAILFKPSLLDDVKFKLIFLRAEEYDAKKAANRLEKHFARKLELFGEDKLAKKITLDDLDENCMKVLNEGPMLELPHTDQTGRPILFFNLGKFTWSDPTSMVSSKMTVII
jgi:hypothetical protein